MSGSAYNLTMPDGVQVSNIPQDVTPDEARRVYASKRAAVPDLSAPVRVDMKAMPLIERARAGFSIPSVSQYPQGPPSAWDAVRETSVRPNGAPTYDPSGAHGVDDSSWTNYQAYYKHNKMYAKPGPYFTKLSPVDEQKYEKWFATTGLSNTPDYDMRGFWKAMVAGSPLAVRAANQHFPDKWKTPYDSTFSRESMYAKPNAPYWDGNNLIETTSVPPASIWDAVRENAGPGAQRLMDHLAQEYGKVSTQDIPEALGVINPIVQHAIGGWGINVPVMKQRMEQELHVTPDDLAEAKKAGIGLSPLYTKLPSVAAPAANGLAHTATSPLTYLLGGAGAAGVELNPAVEAALDATFGVQGAAGLSHTIPELIRKGPEAGDIVETGLDALTTLGGLRGIGELGAPEAAALTPAQQDVEELKHLFGPHAEGEHTVVLTAENPMSQKLSDEENNLRQIQFEQGLQKTGIPFTRGEGIDPKTGNREHVVILQHMPLDAAIRLGREADQSEVFVDGVGVVNVRTGKVDPQTGPVNLSPDTQTTYHTRFAPPSGRHVSFTGPIDFSNPQHIDLPEEETPQVPVPAGAWPSERGFFSLGGVPLKSADEAPSAVGAVDRLTDTLQNLVKRRQSIGAPRDFLHAVGLHSGDRQRMEYALAHFNDAMDRIAPRKREAIVNWMQAGGDEKTLRAEADATKNARLKRGYEDALTLSEPEKEIARRFGNLYKVSQQLGNQEDILSGNVPNYVPQLFKRKGLTEEDEDEMSRQMRSGKLRTNFRYALQRKHPSYFAGEQAGLTPADKDIAHLTSGYVRNLADAISGRRFVKALTKLKTASGEPLAIPEGGRLVDTGEKGATLAIPNLRGPNRAHYEPIDHPALRGWKYAGETEEGKPVIMRGNLLVHKGEGEASGPNVLSRIVNPKTEPKPLNYAEHVRNMLTPSRIQTSPSIGAKLLRGALEGSHIAKGTMFALSPFHAVQEGTMAEALQTNPFAPPPIDINNPVLNIGLDGGLTLGSPREGLSSGGLLGEAAAKLSPRMKRVFDDYEDWLFGPDGYISRLKAQTFQKAFARNMKRYSGSMDQVHIARMTASQVNNAYGGLNLDMIGRSKTVQDAMRLIFLAPDFLESRTRFQFGIGAGGAEERTALAFQAAQLYGIARVANYFLNNGDTHEDAPFSIVTPGGQEYDIRTLTGDIYRQLPIGPRGYENSRQYFGGRLNPVVTKPLLDLVMGSNIYGEKEKPGQNLYGALKSIAPIPLQGLIHERPGQYGPLDTAIESVGAHRRRYLTPAEQMANTEFYGNLPRTPETPDAKARLKVLGRLETDYQTGNAKDIAELLNSGQASEKDRKLARKHAGESLLVRRVTSPDFTLDQMLKVWKYANRAERQELAPILEKKYGNRLKTVSPIEAAREKKRAEKATSTDAYLPPLKKIEELSRAREVMEGLRSLL